MKNLFFFDANSLYASWAPQNKPGITCSVLALSVYNAKGDDLFSFLYCNIDTPLNGYLGLLLIITDKVLKYTFFPL